MIFTYNGKDYNVIIIKKNNKNTYIRIKEDYIQVTTSRFTTKSSIKKLLEENKKTIIKMIEKQEKLKENKKNFSYLGIPYKIVLEERKDTIIDEEKRIIITKNKETLEKYLKKKAETIYKEHLLYYYSIFKENIPNPTLKIRKMTSRWGVCNTKKHIITLNLELIHYNTECLDYVIVHELSHLIEGNHSRAFWQIVEKYYPNYKEIRKKLRNIC